MEEKVCLVTNLARIGQVQSSGIDGERTEVETNIRDPGLTNRRLQHNKYIDTRQQSYRSSNAVSHRIFDDVEEKERGCCLAKQPPHE
jgi:hypothetical protein